MVMDLHRLAEARSLAYHRVIAARLSDATIERAKGVLSRYRERELIGAPYLEAWERLLSGPRSELHAALIADDESSRALRQTTPFSAGLDPRERWALWRAVRTAHSEPAGDLSTEEGQRETR
jgi:hypothetical protein